MANKLVPKWLILLVFTIQLTGCTSLPAQTVEDSDETMAQIPLQKLITTSPGESEGENLEQPAHPDDFYIDLYEVTNQRYAECVADGVCELPLNTIWFDQDAYQDHPVIYVNYPMAQAYCEWRGARLPSQAEWEAAASDELEDLEYYWGDKSPICQIGSRLGEKIDPDSKIDPGTEPAGSYPANAYGLYDMTGSVWEWVDYGQDDQLDSSWESIVSFLRMSSWSGYGPVYSRFLCGFRCASTP